MKSGFVLRPLLSSAILFGAFVARAQTPSVPRFEVASIKPCGNQSGGPIAHTPGRLTIRCQPLLAIISSAYLVYANGKDNLMAALYVPIEGGPSWARSERYEIEAKAAGTPDAAMMNGPMLQSLLEERFQLKAHRETREVPVYALTAAKGGVRLTPFVEGTCTPTHGTVQTGPPAAGSKNCLNRVLMKPPNMEVDIAGISLYEFSRGSILMSLDRPVIDRTGISGRFDLHLEFAPDESTPGLAARMGQRRLGEVPTVDGEPVASLPRGASLFTALQEQLGLKLEPARGPREFLVIDRIERPSEN